MELYTLDNTFLKQDVIDDFNSVIWTERYSKAGDLTLVVPLTQVNIKKYPEGIFVSTPDSDEVMIVETTEKDETAGTLKCTGPTLTGFLNQRFLRTSDTSTDRNWYLGTENLNVWQVMNRLVEETCVTGGDYAGPAGSNFFAIPNLSVADIGYLSAFPKSNKWVVPWGPIYDTLAQLADQYKVGFKVYLEHADKDGYTLKFVSYWGQTKDDVQFSSEMDTLAHIKEIHSISNYKNLALAYTPSDSIHADPGSAWVPKYEALAARGFDLRVQEIVPDNLDKFSGTAADLHDILTQRATTTLSQHPYIHAVDGEVVPNSMVKYGRDYTLGDIIQFKAKDGDVTPARVSEYIRTQDHTGERAYPTVDTGDGMGQAPWQGGAD